ncbi:hypothetical protein DSO57_1039627 [Entomophthora muscae]|uniref:Uncharacterized protein n=1 Tax=Entomophthora muscae TaxID=34485 RepID=A0ACC2UBW9_9FUNG|nr:hypothetical protein DSO57_1039627 [Entomophthora muscae]
MYHIQRTGHTQSMHQGEFTNTKHIGIDKFLGKNKKNTINWLDHSAAKICPSRIPHKRWVQEASKRLYEAAANWFATWVGSKTDKQLDNWEEFKADITHNFRVTESLQDIAIQLSNLPKRTTITAYANEFEEIHCKIQTPAQADNLHTRASLIDRMKPSVAALICPEANTSMPALIAEANCAEKFPNMEYTARNSNCPSNGNGRDSSTSNKRQNTNHSNGNSNCNNGNHSQSANSSFSKKEDTAKVNHAETATCYESDPHSLTSKVLKQRNREKRMGTGLSAPASPKLSRNCTKAQTLLGASHVPHNLLTL